MIKLKEGYSLRKVLDIYVVMGIGSEAYSPNCIMSVNETGALLWDKLKDGAEEADLIEAMLNEYDVSAEQATADVQTFLGQLKAKGLTVA